MVGIPEFRRPRQKHCEADSTLGCTVRLPERRPPETKPRKSSSLALTGDKATGSQSSRSRRNDQDCSQ